MEAAIIMLLAMASVGLWTLRVKVMSRGVRAPASAVAAVEAVVYVSAFGRLLEDVNAPMRLAGFAIGVAAGTYLGMLIDQWLARRGPLRGRRIPRRLAATGHWRRRAHARLWSARGPATSERSSPSCG